MDVFMKNFNARFKWVFLGLGIVWLLFGVKSFFDEKALLATYAPVTATLIEWHLDSSTRYKVHSYCPVYEYTTKDEETRHYSTRACVTNPDLSLVGKQHEQVYYNPENIDAFVETTGWSGTEYSGLFTGIVGLAFCGLLWLIWAVAERTGARAGHCNRFTHKL
jgi:hypothetical protein